MALLVRRRLLSVLDAKTSVRRLGASLQLDFFERAQIEQVITNCEHVRAGTHGLQRQGMWIAYWSPACIRPYTVIYLL